MHDDQVHIDADIARALIDESFPQYRSEPIEQVDSQGTVNAIYRIGSSAAARFPLRAAEPPVLEAELHRQADAMAEFAARCPFPSPRPLGVGRPAKSYPLPWTVQTWLDGDVATANGLSTSRTFASDIARLIRSMRAAETGGRAFDGRGRGGRIADQDGWVQTCLQESAGLLEVPRLRAMWDRLRPLAPATADVMSHKDLIPANLLVRGQHIVGVLDCGDFGPADPALDLVAAWHMLEGPLRDDVRSALDSPADEWLRGAAWAFVQAIGIVWYYRNTNPGMSALGRSTLERLMEDDEVGRGAA